MKWFNRDTENTVCDGMNKNDDPCKSTEIVVIGPGAEMYCENCRNMAGSIVAEKINDKWIKY